MNNGLVTIVLPVYNVELYLDRCMKSIVNQTYTNLEILLIDDGSTDSSALICDEWTNKDSRIKVIHKQNEGLGLARNTGIDNATGEYICFFDSDDFIELNTIEKVYNKAAETNADIVTFGFNTVDSKGDITKRTIPQSDKILYQGEEVLADFLPDLIAPNSETGINKNFWMSAWASMYSMKLIREVNWKFVSERLIISEDVYSLLELYSSVKRVAICKEAFYNYCENDTNSLTRKFRKDRYLQQKKFLLACLEICTDKQYSLEVRRRLYYQFLGNTIGAIKRIIMSNEKIINRYRTVKYILNDELLQDVVRQLVTVKESFARKLLFFSIRNRLNILSFVLLYLQTKKTIN